MPIKGLAAMPEPGEQAEEPATDDALIREIIAIRQYLRAVSDEIARSYKNSGSKFNTQAKIADHFGTKQERVSEWLNGKFPASSISDQHDKMLELLRALGLDVKSLWKTATSAQSRTCLDPDCPTLRFYLIDGSVVACPKGVSGGSEEECGWCFKPLSSICECGRPIRRAAFCRCGLTYVAGACLG